MSKQQIRHSGGDEKCGRRRVELLNPFGGETHTKVMYLDRWTKLQSVTKRGNELGKVGEAREQRGGVSKK